MPDAGGRDRRGCGALHLRRRQKNAVVRSIAAPVRRSASTKLRGPGRWVGGCGRCVHRPAGAGRVVAIPHRRAAAIHHLRGERRRASRLRQNVRAPGQAECLRVLGTAASVFGLHFDFEELTCQSQEVNPSLSTLGREELLNSLTCRIAPTGVSYSKNGRKASCTARMACSPFASSMTTEILISLVEIISMLMPDWASAPNILAATPE